MTVMLCRQLVLRDPSGDPARPDTLRRGDRLDLSISYGGCVYEITVRPRANAGR